MRRCENKWEEISPVRIAVSDTSGRKKRRTKDAVQPALEAGEASVRAYARI